MGNTNLTNQRQVYLEEYIRSGENHYAGDAVQSIRDGVLDNLTGSVSYTHLTLPTILLV